MKTIVLFVLMLGSLACSQSSLEQRETKHFRFKVESSVSALDDFIAEADEVFVYVSERMGVPYYGRIEVALRAMSEEACPVRGMMVEGADGFGTVSIIIYVSQTMRLEQLLGVLAHELGHLLDFNGFRVGKPVWSSGLTEGLATWAAGRYYLAWRQTPSLGASVKRYLAAKRYLPLENKPSFRGIYPDQNAADDCLSRRDTLYTEWAAFTEYLIDTYGVERFKRLLVSKESEADEEGVLPNFAGVYGESFEVLVERWLKSVERNER